MGFGTFADDFAKQVAEALAIDGSGKSLTEVMKYNAARSGRAASFNKLQSMANPIVNSMSEAQSKEWAEALAKNTDLSGAVFGNSAFDSAMQAFKGQSDANAKIVSDFTDMLSKYNGLDNTTSKYAEFLHGEGNTKLGAFTSARGYFFDPEYGKARRATTLAAGAGVAVAGRYLSGGTLTRRNTGERDIAGVPFI